MSDEAKELATIWLGLVDTDIAMARRALPDLIGPAAFHVQQAVEKLLKAAIVLQGLEPAKIHDLTRLFDVAKADLAWDESEQWLKEKSGWATVTRY